MLKDYKDKVAINKNVKIEVKNLNLKKLEIKNRRCEE